MAILRTRIATAALAAAIGVTVAGGAAWAVTATSAGTDRYSACVGIGGRVRQDTIRLNHAPASCPKPLDTVHSWNAEGPPGPPGTSNVGTLKVVVNPPNAGFVQAQGISCSGLAGRTDNDCTEVYPLGTAVDLVATPQSGQAFVGWTGGGCSGTASCSLAATGDKTVTATFGAVQITKAPLLVTDANHNGTVSPGDTLQYTIVVTNRATVAVPNQVIADLVGAAAQAPEAPRTAALVVGSVTTSAGTITEGNVAGDTDVRVTVPSIAPSGVVTVRYRAIAHPKTATGHGIVFGPWVLNAATLNGTIAATDPNPPTSGPCAVVNFGSVCVNADGSD